MVLALGPSQVEMVGDAPVEEKSVRELAEAERRRVRALGAFLGTMVNDLLEEP